MALTTGDIKYNTALRKQTVSASNLLSSSVAGVDPAREVWQSEAALTLMTSSVPAGFTDMTKPWQITELQTSEAQTGK